MAKNHDYRLHVGWFDNLKFQRIFACFGGNGVLSILLLWEYAAAHKPTGSLGKVDDLDLSILLRCRLLDLDSSTFIPALMNERFLTRSECGELRIHEWEEHQPWASGADQRSRNSSKAGKASARSRAESRIPPKSATKADPQRVVERPVQRKHEFRSTPRSTPDLTSPDLPLRVGHGERESSSKREAAGGVSPPALGAGADPRGGSVQEEAQKPTTPLDPTTPEGRAKPDRAQGLVREFLAKLNGEQRKPPPKPKKTRPDPGKEARYQAYLLDKEREREEEFERVAQEADERIRQLLEAGEA